MKNISVALLIAVIILGARSANAQDAAGIFAIREDGTGLKELSKGHSGINQVRFSPDGSKLVFDAKVRDVPRPHCGGIAGQPPVNGKLFLMNNDGSDLHELRGYSSAFEPVFTPDGKKILFTQYDNSAGTCNDKLLGIYSMNLDGTDATLVVPDATDASISYDGTKLLFRKSLPGEFPAGGFYISKPDGSDARRIGNVGGVYESKAIFNPRDSSEIMFTNTATSTIFTINVLTLTRTVVLQAPNDRRAGIVTFVDGADYSPDGKTVVYSARVSDIANLNDHEGYLDHSEIYESARGGTSVRRITNSELKSDAADPSSPNSYTQAYDPTYSPDGKTIVFIVH